MNEVKQDGGKSAVPNPDKLIRSIDTDMHEAECWLVREQNKVWDMAAGAVVSVAVGVLLAWLSRKMLRRLIRSDPAAWKWKILNALILPLLFSAVLIACLLFSLPVLRTLPSCEDEPLLVSWEEPVLLLTVVALLPEEEPVLRLTVVLWLLPEEVVLPVVRRVV